MTNKYAIIWKTKQKKISSDFGPNWQAGVPSYIGSRSIQVFSGQSIFDSKKIEYLLWEGLSLSYGER